MAHRRICACLPARPVKRHPHPVSRSSIAMVVLGIMLVAAAVMTAVPVAMNWPTAWPGALLVVAFACAGVALIARHKSHHRKSAKA